MPAKLSYVIKFVKNMDAAVKFYRDTLGLPLKFESPDWSEFTTGEVALALHPSSDNNPPGKMELCFHVEDLAKFYEEMRAKGLRFTMPPTEQDFGRLLAQFLDSEDSPSSVSSS
jgi:catechol 2,3-dioxygenase-like lactoylglutathione lyase family enzyme